MSHLDECLAAEIARADRRGEEITAETLRLVEAELAARSKAETVIDWISTTGQMHAHGKTTRPVSEREIVILAHSLARAVLTPYKRDAEAAVSAARTPKCDGACWNAVDGICDECVEANRRDYLGAPAARTPEDDPPLGTFIGGAAYISPAREAVSADTPEERAVQERRAFNGCDDHGKSWPCSECGEG